MIMNRIYTLLVATAIFSAPVMAQEEQKSDTTKIKLGDLSVLLVEEKDSSAVSTIDIDSSTKEELTHWGGVDVGVNMLLSPNGGIDLGEGNEWLDQNYARSMSWNFNLIEKKIRIVEDYAGIITGVGLSYNSFGLADSVNVENKFSIFEFDDDGMLINETRIDSTNGVFNSNIEYTKNKLRTSSLRIPILLEFNTSNNNERSFHVAAGVIGGWQFSTIVKQKYEEEGHSYKNRKKGDYNVSDFSLDAHLRVGYRDFTLWANMGLAPFFQDGKGPEVYPMSVGLSLVPW